MTSADGTNDKSMAVAEPPQGKASSKFVTVDGNEAAAFVAHQVSEVIAIYPITPAYTRLADG